MSKKITTSLILCFLLGNVFSLCFISTVSAASFKPQITMGDFKKGGSYDVGSGDLLGRYIKEIYKYSLGFVGILACVVLMFGGFLWITAGGNGERVGNAKAWIGASLSGLVLMLCSYTILYMVNPALVNFEDINVSTPETIETEEDTGYNGCCYFEDENNAMNDQALLKTENDCLKLEGSWKGTSFTPDQDSLTCIATNTTPGCELKSWNLLGSSCGNNMQQSDYESCVDNPTPDDETKICCCPK